MTVLRQYNSGNSQWEPVVVGKQGPPGTGGGGGPFAGASKATILNSVPFTIYPFGHPDIDPSAFKFQSNVDFWQFNANNLFTVTDPDGVLTNQMPIGDGVKLAQAGDYLIKVTYIGGYVPTNETTFRVYTMLNSTGSVIDIASERSSENGDRGLLLMGSVTTSDITDGVYLSTEVTHNYPGDIVPVTRHETTLYFWPSA